jgi:hypothetical protein
LSFGERFAALHRGGRELGLRLVAADDEHQQVLFARLVVGDVHEAARDADREGDDVIAIQVGVFHCLALVPLGAPAAGHADKCLVRVVVVHQRAFARLRLAVAEVEAFGDGDCGLGGGIRADGRVSRLRWLEAEDVEQLPPALGQWAVGQAAIGTLEGLEARDPLHHLGLRPGANVFPVSHASSS